MLKKRAKGKILKEIIRCDILNQAPLEPLNSLQEGVPPPPPPHTLEKEGEEDDDKIR